jgi:hypothetical protein
VVVSENPEPRLGRRALGEAIEDMGAPVILADAKLWGASRRAAWGCRDLVWRGARRGGGAFDALAADDWRSRRFRATKITEKHPSTTFLERRGEDANLLHQRRSPPRSGQGATILHFAPGTESARPAAQTA